MLPNWPYLTKEFPGLPGVIKASPEDFIVEEIPAYDPCGEGDHTYFLIEKKGLTTLELIRRLGRTIGRQERDFGYAGLKDSQAITRQMISLEHVDVDTIKALDIPGVKILSVSRHTNKLKRGHLYGNKFWIKLRDIEPMSKAIARPCLEMLESRGIPNYFGNQRFGIRGDSWILGGAILRDDFKAFLDQFCGKPYDHERDHVKKARDFYDKGRYELAAEIWPAFFRDTKRCCKILAGNPKAYFKAFKSVDRKLTTLFLSAYQSYLFNEAMAKRIDTIDKVLLGDLAYKEDNGAVFRVEDPEVEQLRADRFEISPTGPIFGYRMTMPEVGEECAIEEAILKDADLILDDFKKPKGAKLRGSRRPFRVRMANLAVSEGGDEDGRFLSLSFDLPSGSYATAVLRELMKEHFSPQIISSPE